MSPRHNSRSGLLTLPKIHSLNDSVNPIILAVQQPGGVGRLKEVQVQGLSISGNGTGTQVGIHYNDLDRSGIMGCGVFNTGMQGILLEKGQGACVVAHNFVNNNLQPNKNTLTDYHGALEIIGGADIVITGGEYGAGGTIGTMSGSKKSCALVMKNIGSGSVIDGIYEVSDQGIYLENVGGFRFHGVRSDHNNGSGWIINNCGSNSFMGCHSMANNAANDPDGHGFLTQGNTNLNAFIGCVVSLSGRKDKVVDAFNDKQNSGQDWNSYIGCIARSGTFSNLKFNFGTYLPARVNLTPGLKLQTGNGPDVDVNDQTLIKVGGADTTPIRNLLNGAVGQIVTIYCEAVGQSLETGGNLRIIGGTTRALKFLEAVQFVCVQNDKWYEIGPRP
jgi:hypothetical protein